ncbi:MAG: hypothetical protein J1E57_06580 [Prevotella sp.]|nr:hypothetical protein [Prevotella sp.]
MEEKTKINDSKELMSIVSEETITEEQSISVVSVDYEHEKKHTPSESESINNFTSSQLEIGSKPNNTCFRLKVKTWLKSVFTKFSSTYSKRNSIVNALLSLFLIATLIVSLMVFVMSLTILVRDFKGGWSFAVGGMFYPLFCTYFMCRFVIANQKRSIFPAFMGSIFVWYVILFFYVVITTPNSAYLDDEGNESPDSWIISYVWPFILSVLLNVLLFLFVYLVMRIRKYGASAWILLDISRGERSKLEKTGFVLFSAIWLLPIGVFTYHNYKVSHTVNEYPSHNNAKIGDYYYEDGTVDSELIHGKQVIGVVFSLETSDTDKMMGYNHGQIVAINDASEYKVKWEDGTPMDYVRYPNYQWGNRLDALMDIDGSYYKKCNDTYCLDINLLCNDYLHGSGDGISDWYLPTAGQWANILENLGKVKVDKMLKFDAKTASVNLEKIGIIPTRWYWTITEFDAENAWSIRIADGEFGSRSNKQNGAYVRPVASF